MNGTYRELERRLRAYEARTGHPFSSCWISHERWALLPQAVRDSHTPHPSSWRPRPLTIQGVTVHVIEVLAPEGQQRHG